MSATIIVMAQIIPTQVVHVRCPYCGNEFRQMADTSKGMEVAYCDVDDTPGCGKAFVFKVPAVVPVTIESFSIEAQP